MAKYVFLNFPAYGHVNPTLAIVQELTRGGEEAVYYLSEQFRNVVERHGAEFRAYPFGMFAGGPGSSRGGTPGDKRLAMLPILMAQQSTRVVPQLVRSIRAAKPDCLVYDSMFLWGRLVARILGVRAVGLRPSYAHGSDMAGRFAMAYQMPPELITAADEELSRLAASYQMPAWSVRALIADLEPLMIVFLPREFQPGGETLDKRFLFVGPSLRPHDLSSEDFPTDWLDHSRPHLYISLGTIFNDQAEFYRACLRAFGGTVWRVIMSVGPHIEIGSLGTLPDNVLVVPRVPQLEVLPRMDVFVSHGGMNSIMESLYFGVPVVVVPSITEQQVTAERIQELGLGLALDHDGLTPDGLREAVGKVARDPSIRTRVKLMQEKTRSAGGSRRATAAIMEFARNK